MCVVRVAKLEFRRSSEKTECRVSRVALTDSGCVYPEPYILLWGGWPDPTQLAMSGPQFGFDVLLGRTTLQRCLCPYAPDGDFLNQSFLLPLFGSLFRSPVFRRPCEGSCHLLMLAVSVTHRPTETPIPHSIYSWVSVAKGNEPRTKMQQPAKASKESLVLTEHETMLLGT